MQQLWIFDLIGGNYPLISSLLIQPLPSGGFGLGSWNFGSALAICLSAFLWSFSQTSNWILLCLHHFSAAAPAYLSGLGLGLCLLPCLLRVRFKGRGLGFWSVMCLLATAPERWIWVDPPVALAMEPSSAADMRRAGYRDPKGILPSRVARKSTLDARTKLLNEFGEWLCESEGVLLTPLPLLTAKPVDPE